MEGQDGTQQPHLVLAHKLFLLSHPDVQDIEKVRLREEVFASVKADGNNSPFQINRHPFFYSMSRILFHISGFLLHFVDMAPLYETLVAESVLELDQGILNSMREKIEEELKKLDEKWVCSLLFILIWFGFTFGRGWR